MYSPSSQHLIGAQPPGNAFLNGGISAFSPTNLHLYGGGSGVHGISNGGSHSPSQYMSGGGGANVGVVHHSAGMVQSSPQPSHHQQQSHNVPPMFNDFNDQINWLNKELKSKELKLEECQMSIKTFWNPELKKERMARMSDNEKYQQLKQDYDKLANETDRNSVVIQHLSGELQHQREVSSTVLPQSDNQINALRVQLNQKENEALLMRKTLEEMELRIETQKETLASRDQSIKKLLEIIQDRGLANNMETNLDYSQTKLRNVELETQVSELTSKLSVKDKEVNSLKADLMHHLETSANFANQASSTGKSSIELTSKLQSYKAVLENKEDTLRSVQQRVDYLEEELNKYKISSGIMNFSGLDNFGKQHQILNEHMNFLKNKVDQLRAEVSRKESDLIAAQTRLDILNKQNMDYSSHINVLRETLSAKEQQNSSLKADLDAARNRLQEKQMQLQKKSMELDNTQLEKSNFEQELRDILQNKEKKISNLERKISQLEDSLKDRDNRIQALSAAKRSVTSVSQSDLVETLEKTLGEKEKQIESMKEQREKDLKDRIEEVDLYSRISKELQGKNEDLVTQVSDKETQLVDTNEKASSLMVANMKKDSQIKILTTNLMQKQDDLLELEKKVRKINEEKIALVKEKQEAHKQIDALEEQVNHYIDELAKTQSQLDKLTEVLRRSEQEKKVHERRALELELNLSNVKEKLNGIKRSKDDERILNAHLLNDARKREGEVIHDVQELQEIIGEKDRRISELEDALNETAKMTVAREAALDQHHLVTNHAQQKIEQLQIDNEDLQRALGTSNKKLTDLAFQVTEKEAKVQQLQMDRRRQMEEVMQMRQEVILATINEKQANISLLEASGSQNPVVMRDLKKLHEDKQKLLRQLNEVNDKRAKMIHALENKMSGKSKPRGLEEDGVWA